MTTRGRGGGELVAVAGACPWCGEPVEIAADPSGGRVQELVEDCAVCCRPSLVRVSFTAEGDVEANWAREGG